MLLGLPGVLVPISILQTLSLWCELQLGHVDMRLWQQSPILDEYQVLVAVFGHRSDDVLHCQHVQNRQNQLSSFLSSHAKHQKLQAVDSQLAFRASLRVHT